MNEVKKYIKDEIFVDMTIKRKRDDCIVFTLIALMKSKAKETGIKRLTLNNINMIYNDIVKKCNYKICYISNDDGMNNNYFNISAIIDKNGKLIGARDSNKIYGGNSKDLENDLYFCSYGFNEDFYLEKIKEKLFKGYKSKFIEYDNDTHKLSKLLAELSYYRVQKNNELYINEYKKIKKRTTEKNSAVGGKV